MPSRAAVERAFRSGSGRAVATLARAFRDLDLAEEMVQEAYLAALQRWPAEGVPPSPVGWIVTTARRRAIDRLRREATRGDRHRHAAALLYVPDDDAELTKDATWLEDDTLRLVFTCCHPALAQPARNALTLRLVVGLQPAEIARAFLVSETALAQRLVRAKRKIRDARIPYRVPEPDELPDRLESVLEVLYLLFNEGYIATQGLELGRPDLAAEAIRVTRLVRSRLPEMPEITGLLALMLLSEARSSARASADGTLVPLAEQDRSLWDAELIREGHALVRECLRIGRPGRYQLQGAIQAVHTSASKADATDWQQIVALYDQLLQVAGTDVVALNRAVAVAQLRGPEAGLDALRHLQLERYHLFHAVHAELLERLARRDEALAALDRALERVENQAERALLLQRRNKLAQ